MLHHSISNSDDENEDADDSKMMMKKSHGCTICMVPSSAYKDVWDAVTKVRTELRDPGLYRWPPHANLLYPFYEINNPSSSLWNDIRLAIQQIQPFDVTLDSFGTFGGSNRGVLWLYPRSYPTNTSTDQSKQSNSTPPKQEEDGSKQVEPLVQLQSLLESCTINVLENATNQQNRRHFTPHITVSHFLNLDDAKKAQRQMEQSWKPLSFHVSHIYYLQRIHDNDQFHIIAKLPLGNQPNNTDIQFYSPPQRFTFMPLEEQDWVREERMKLKKRRNGRQRRRPRKNTNADSTTQTNNRGPSKSKDTPEQIAAKRAARAAKKRDAALLQKQTNEQQSTMSSSSMDETSHSQN